MKKVKDVGILWKRCLWMAAICAIFVACVIAWLFHGKEGSVPVLNYHQINDVDRNALTVTTEQFEAQMKYLAEEGYQSITPQEMLDAWESGTPLPEKPVVITFDDGYADNYRNAFPILEKYRMKATIFLISDYISLYPKYLTWSQAAEMQDSGLIQFESHTMSHADLTKAESTSEIRHQLSGSKQGIEWHLHNDVRFIAYPCGDYTEEIMALTKDMGYRAAFTVNYGWANPQEQRFLLNRIPIFGGNQHTFLRFKLRLAYAPLIAPLAQLREDLLRSGFPQLASFVLMP